MSLGAPAAPVTAVNYPDSDGRPMADNTKQARWITVLFGNLCALFRDAEQRAENAEQRAENAEQRAENVQRRADRQADVMRRALRQQATAVELEELQELLA